MNNLFKSVAVFGILMMSGASAVMAGSAPSGPGAWIVQELRWVFAYKKPVRVGKLMTKQEKMEYRRAMQVAKTPEARQQIRELTYAKLGLRARERGMFVVMPTTNTTHPVREEVVRQVQKESRAALPVQQVQKENRPAPQVRREVREPMRVLVSHPVRSGPAATHQPPKL